MGSNTQFRETAVHRLTSIHFVCLSYCVRVLVLVCNGIPAVYLYCHSACLHCVFAYLGRLSTSVATYALQGTQNVKCAWFVCSPLICRPEESGEPSGVSPVARGKKKGKDGKRHGKAGKSETPNAEHGKGIPHRSDKVKGKSKVTAMSAASPHAEDTEMAHSSVTAPNPAGRKGKKRHAADNKAAVVADISSKRLKAYGLIGGTTKKRQGIRKAARSKRTA